MTNVVPRSRTFSRSAIAARCECWENIRLVSWRVVCSDYFWRSRWRYSIREVVKNLAVRLSRWEKQTTVLKKTSRIRSQVSDMNAASVLLTGGSWVTVFLFCCLLSLLLILLVERGKFLYALRKVPYPTALPVIGNAYQLNCSQEGKISRLSKSTEVFAIVSDDWHLMCSPTRCDSLMHNYRTDIFTKNECM